MFMDDYRKALIAYLAQDGRTQESLAGLIKSSQAAVNRYVNGKRFPDAEMARAIDEATRGEVPFATWQKVATARLLGEPCPFPVPSGGNQSDLEDAA